MFSKLSFVAIAALSLFGLSTAAPIPSSSTLADGTSFKYIALSAPLDQLQVTGVATMGCSLTSDIDSCTTLSLGSDPSKELDTHFPNSPRQRIEFRSESYPAGSTYTFTWKQFLPSGTGTSDNFFHLMQVFDQDKDFPVFVTDAKNGKLSMEDFERSNCGGGCPSVEMSEYTGKTTSHSLTITFGPSGKASYTISDAGSGDNLLSYSASGAMGGSETYVKFGTYRQAFSGMGPITAAVGDFTATKH